MCLRTTCRTTPRKHHPKAPINGTPRVRSNPYQRTTQQPRQPHTRTQMPMQHHHPPPCRRNNTTYMLRLQPRQTTPKRNTPDIAPAAPGHFGRRIRIGSTSALAMLWAYVCVWVCGTPYIAGGMGMQVWGGWIIVQTIHTLPTGFVMDNKMC